MFWLVTIPTLLLICSLLIFLTMKARQVPTSEQQDGKSYRLHPEYIRLLAYLLVILVCLAAAMYELSLYD